MITVKAYAKINLALNVFDKRSDGYHDVDMVMLPLELHDIIEIDTLPNGYESYITCDDTSLPTDESNLSYKAFLKLREKFDINKNFMIHVYKRIPISAGLGGGSADAAAVFNAITKKLKIKLEHPEIIDITKTIGGDVPFCMYNRPARCKGIGEELEFFTLKRRYYVLLIKPEEGVTTAQAYNDFDKLTVKPELSNIDALINALENDDDEVIAREMKNGLQECAINLVPEIKNIIEILKNDGFNMVLMSGSGSTVFAMSKNKFVIEKEAKKFDKKKYKVVVTHTL
jgi:4-diphosphocytidyl-2-C-methyl-D-erythritol kinase